jgi:hypothetical protein
VKRIAVEISRGEAGDRSAALSALNILGHPSLIPVVIPLIEGKVRTYEKRKKTNTHTHTQKNMRIWEIFSRIDWLFFFSK